MRRIDLILVTYALSQELLELFTAADAPNVFWRVFTHSAHEDVLMAVRAIEARAKLRMCVYDYQTNRGLARSWNDGIYYAYMTGADLAVLINDDMLPGREDVQRVARAAMLYPHVGIVKCMGFDERSQTRTSMEFGLTGITRAGWEQVGAFDEMIWPIYWEDIDWERRRKLLGVEEYMVVDTHARHAGSKTAIVTPNGVAQAQVHYDVNARYYRDKWGGTHLEGERFTHPFNNPALGCYISPARRHNPYPSEARKP
ncbi:MAG: glycosyltransferase family 2 protein [Anaerolineae bacterium]|nr:glycosyltransferase family 2 protein [Anaerolineae bacterium]